MTTQSLASSFSDYSLVLSEKGKLSEDKRLNHLFDLYWKKKMERFPELATSVGYAGQNDRWSSLSADSIEENKAEPKARLKALKSIDRAHLSESSKLNYDLFEQVAKENLEAASFPSELIPLNQMEGLQHFIPSLFLQAPTKTKADYLDRISRLEKIPLLVDETIELMKKGMKKKITPPQIVLRNVPDQVKSLFNESMSDNPLYVSFQNIGKELDSEDRKKLQESAAKTIQEKAFPAFKKLHQFLINEYLPHCRKDTAWNTLPQGKSWYLHWVKAQTTTHLSPTQIHKMGIAEVERIEKKMLEIKNKVQFKGSLEAFYRSIQADSKFVHQNKDEFIAEFKSYVSELEPKLPQFFSRFPKLGCEIKPVPAFSEKSQPAAYIEPGSIEQGRPSVFFANTYDLSVTPKWKMRTLFLHEAIPGHHFQLVLAQENGDLPEFRKFLDYNSFIEGWALYSETLGYEMDFFKDPYSQLGQLSDEMLRAVRLVVDTGMHSLGWSRQKGIDYFKLHTLSSDLEATVEIDRYLVLPGQALSYKIGQLKLTQFRAEAEKKLGARFKIQEFHDLFLRNGTLPLNVLEKLVKQWVGQKNEVAFN